MIKFHSIKNKITEHRSILDNFYYLSLTQLFNLIYPLITYPYLVKTLGASVFGLVVFIQALCGYFSMIVIWGFDTTATKEISIFRNNKQKLSEIISSVFIIRFILWCICFIFFIFLINIIPQLNEYKYLCFFTFFISLNELMVPIWYFRGIEKMKYITYITIFIRSIFLITIFLFIHKPDDYLYVPLLNSVGIFCGGVVAIYFVFIKDKNVFIIPSMHILINYMKDAFPIFISDAVVSIKDRFNIIFIGIFLGTTNVAIYDLALKIMNIFMQPISVANHAIFPRISITKNMDFVKKFMFILAVSITILIILIQPFLSSILDFLSNDLEGTLLPTEILLLSPIIMVFSLTIARNCFLIWGFYRYILIGSVYTTIFYLILIGMGYVSNQLNNIYFFALVTVLSFLFELVYRLYICYKKNLLKLY